MPVLNTSTNNKLRPLNQAGRRISPAELGDYCEVRGIFRPYCLCPFMSEDLQTYPQASICKAKGGTHAETYVVQCAGSEGRQHCDYFGKLLPPEWSQKLCSFKNLLSSAATTHICAVLGKSLY